MSIIEFGKYKAKTLAEIYELDPNFCLWCYRKSELYRSFDSLEQYKNYLKEKRIKEKICYERYFDPILKNCLCIYLIKIKGNNFYKLGKSTSYKAYEAIQEQRTKHMIPMNFICRWYLNSKILDNKIDRFIHLAALERKLIKRLKELSETKFGMKTVSLIEESEDEIVAVSRIKIGLKSDEWFEIDLSTDEEIIESIRDDIMTDVIVTMGAAATTSFDKHEIERFHKYFDLSDYCWIDTTVE